MLFRRLGKWYHLCGLCENRSKMKKFILLSGILLFLGFTSYAQQAPRYVYCQLIGTQRMMSTKFTVSVDYGQGRKLFQNYRIKDAEAGKPRIYNSMIDAMNDMASSGWEFEQALYISEPRETHYILKKRYNNLDKEEQKEYEATGLE